MRLPAALVVFAAALLVAAACQETEEAGQDSSPTETASATPTPAPTLLVPTPTLPPIPADWPTYTDPGGLFTVRYPSNWIEIDGDFFSADPRDSKSYSLPPEIVKVEVVYYEAAGKGCGAISRDPNTGAMVPEVGATPTILGGVEAWQIVRVRGVDAAIEENLTRIDGISAIHKEHCFNIAAYFTQETPDVVVFPQIASTFQFTF